MKIVRARRPHLYNFHEENFGIIDKLLTKARRGRSELIRHNRRMFDEDFARIFSLLNQRGGDLFDINSNNKDLEARLLGNVTTRHRLHLAGDTIKTMVEDIAESLVWFGDSYYFLTDDQERKKIYVTSRFAADRIFHFIGMYFQLLPKRYDRQRNKEDQELPSEFRILDRSKLMHFRLPRSIGRMLSAQNSILASIDNHQNADIGFWPHATHENPNRQYDFDFRKWRDTQDHALYRATRKTGWNGRMDNSSKTSDFFNCHRLIRFRRNQLKLRDGILGQLSSEFTRVGKQYKTGFHIVVTPTNALPTVSDLDELAARLSREEVGFTEVMDFCIKR